MATAINQGKDGGRDQSDCSKRVKSRQSWSALKGELTRIAGGVAVRCERNEIC
jgi:hypothetical protein